MTKPYHDQTSNLVNFPRVYKYTHASPRRCLRLDISVFAGVQFITDMN